MWTKDKLLGLSSIDVSDFNTSNVTDMYSMFYGCYGLNSIDISNFEISSSTYCYNMFNYNTELKTVYVKNTTIKGYIQNAGGFPSGCQIIVK